MNIKPVIGPLAAKLSSGIKGLGVKAMTNPMATALDPAEMGTLIARIPENAVRIRVALAGLAGVAYKLFGRSEDK